MFHNIPIGKNAPEEINVVVEIPKGSHNKYELDEETGVIVLDRVLHGFMHYPTDYGFIPETRSEDGDHLDALVIGGDPVFIGCVVTARPVGLLKMIDDGEEDFKIIAVQKDNPRFKEINTLEDLRQSMPHFEHETTNFFEHYKDLEKKEVKILGWEDVRAAKNEIQRAQRFFKEEQQDNQQPTTNNQ